MFRAVLILNVGLQFLAVSHPAAAQESDTTVSNGAAPAASTTSKPDDTPKNVLPAAEWRRIDSAVNRGLEFLAAQQQPDGSFPTEANAQPGVTSLCVLAFLAHGQNPGSGPYGERLDRAVKYIVGCQKPSGLIMLLGDNEPQINRQVERNVGITGTYDHAISSLTLGELYGMNPSQNAPLLKAAINKSLQVTLAMQHWPKDMPEDEGGWRYIRDIDRTDSDLSVTGWHLMFLRSARNAGFAVPEQAIADAVAYIRRTFSQQYGTFTYTTKPGDVRTRGMAGAGILAFAHAGFHNAAEAKRAAEDVLGYSSEVYSDSGGTKRDQYHYGLFMCCQGMYQMGSPYWEKFFPPTIRAVLAHQQPNGSWDAESWHADRRYGNSYATAIVILAIGAPNQLLPVFQR